MFEHIEPFSFPKRTHTNNGMLSPPLRWSLSFPGFVDGYGFFCFQPLSGGPLVIDDRVNRDR